MRWGQRFQNGLSLRVGEGRTSPRLGGLSPRANFLRLEPGSGGSGLFPPVEGRSRRSSGEGSFCSHRCQSGLSPRAWERAAHAAFGRHHSVYGLSLGIGELSFYARAGWRGQGHGERRGRPSKTRIFAGGLSPRAAGAREGTADWLRFIPARGRGVPLLGERWCDRFIPLRAGR